MRPLPWSAWTLGEVARLELTVADADGVPTDPASLALKVRTPAGAVSTHAHGDDPDLVREGAGRYRYDLPLTAAGSWWWRWEAAAPAAGASEGRLDVAPSPFS